MNKEQTIIRMWTLMAFSAMLFALTINPAYASRHAVLVYDADTGKVLQHEHGYAQRYPASLTKMMTLYLLFDEMKKGKISLHSSMKASQHAASQPQTNISLRKGDNISVEQAIKALVVRSANDVAVVIAEHVGGSEANFAKMATQKARQLGMKNTTFKNPHGLPDSRQVTTAYDMALLGAALRRDFPQYYHYFTTQKFSYKGRHYTSHNRVLKRLGGVDGIKTGFIRASGFNLVSSYKRGNVNLVAVVMGGTSSGERDNRMVKLLSQTSTKLAAERGGHGAPDVAYASATASSFVPSPVLKPQQTLSAASQMASTASYAAPAAQKIAVNAAPKDKSSMENPDMLDKLVADVTSSYQRNIAPVIPSRQQATTATPTVAKPGVTLAFNQSATTSRTNSLGISLDLGNATTQKPAAQSNKAMVTQHKTSRATPQPSRQTLDYQLATLNQEFPVPRHIFENEAIEQGKDWAVQIGIFQDTMSARRALSETARDVHHELRDAIAYVEYAEMDNKRFHRARLKNLSQQQAQSVCQKLATLNKDCFTIKNN